METMVDRNEVDLLEKTSKIKRYGGKYCVAYGCKQFSGEHSKQQGITFHAFPWSKPDLVAKWEHSMHRIAFKATKHSVVCSTHFTPDCFDRTGLRVQLKAGALPTIFNLSAHLVKPVRRRKTPAERNCSELTAAKVSRPITSLSVEHSYVPTLEPSRKRLINDCSTDLSVASGVGSHTTVLSSNLRVCNGHNYCLPSPKVLKKKFRLMESELSKYKHKVKILRQKNRRLQLKFESLQQLLFK